MIYDIIMYNVIQLRIISCNIVSKESCLYHLKANTSIKQVRVGQDIYSILDNGNQALYLTLLLRFIYNIVETTMQV